LAANSPTTAFLTLRYAVHRIAATAIFDKALIWPRPPRRRNSNGSPRSLMLFSSATSTRKRLDETTSSRALRNTNSSALQAIGPDTGSIPSAIGTGRFPSSYFDLLTP